MKEGVIKFKFGHGSFPLELSELCVVLFLCFHSVLNLEQILLK